MLKNKGDKYGIRFVLVLILVVLCALNTIVVASAVNSETISIVSPDSDPVSGETITLPITISNTTNVTGVYFELKYDSSKVIIKSITANNTIQNSSVNSNINNITGNASVSLTNIDSITTTLPTPIIDVTFDVVGTTGTTTLDLQNVEFSDDNFSVSTPGIVHDGTIYIATIIVLPSTVSFDTTDVKLPINSMKTLNLTIDNLPSGLSGYNITVSLSNESVAEIISVDFPSWAVVNSNGSLSGDSVWLKGADLMDGIKSGTSNVLLATLTVRGDIPGNTNVVITVESMDDDGGNQINSNIINTQLEVISVTTFPTMSLPPTDPDGDGLYEDINGNGRIDFDDVVKYFNYLEWIPNNEPIPSFDFNGNGRIDFDDIVKLFNKV